MELLYSEGDNVFIRYIMLLSKVFKVKKVLYVFELMVKGFRIL